MVVTLAPQESHELIGNERRVQLADERAPRFHGTLTGQLLAILERVDPGSNTLGDLERSLKAAFEHDIGVNISDANRSRWILTDDSFMRACELIAYLDEQPWHAIIAGLEEEITRRQQQGDGWPEGRLNVGIAYACFGDLETAQRWLYDAVNMLRYPSSVPRGEQMAA